MSSITEQLHRSVDDVNDSMVALRRDLHQNPELGFQEHRTTKVIKEYAESLSLTERPYPTPTGAVFEREGGRPGATVLLRADIDALPIDERGRRSFLSKNGGTMHACDHDAHTAQPQFLFLRFLAKI